jgi:pSer/pThr/pTyr-binding forkhead associated (FHA) protein
MIPYRARLKVTIVLLGNREIHSLDGDNFVFGRSIKSNLYIKDPALSRSHLKIFINHKALWLIDMSSTNATYVNDLKMQKDTSSQLNYGDIISIENSDTQIIIDDFEIYQLSYEGSLRDNNTEASPPFIQTKITILL